MPQIIQITLLIALIAFFPNINCQTRWFSLDSERPIENYYTIIAPHIIKPNTEYGLVISVHKSNEPLTFKLGIQGPSYFDTKLITVNPNSIGKLKFDIPNISNGFYMLFGEGPDLHNHKDLQYVSGKKNIILIQTDKALYKPKDLVRYRVLVLDENMKPFKNAKTVDVTTIDPKGNKVQQLTALLNTGVMKFDLQLSIYPIFGEWEIQVNVDNEIEVKNFEVAEYVLPKFEITIDCPTHFAHRDKKVGATIRAKYTYGKPVKGEAIVTITKNRHIRPGFYPSHVHPSYPTYPLYPNQQSQHQYYIPGTNVPGLSIPNPFHVGYPAQPASQYPPYAPPFYPSGQIDESLIVKKTIQFNGKGRVEFDIIDELKIPKTWSTPEDFTISAVVEEELTKVQLNITKEIKIHPVSGRIEAVGVFNYYEPNSPFEITLKVIGNDGKPIVDTTNPLLVRILTPEDYVEIARFENKLNDEGMVTAKFIIPGNETYQVRVSYLDIKSMLGVISPNFETTSNRIEEKERFTIKMKSEKFTLDTDISVEVRANENMDYFIYQIFGRDKILETELIQVPNRDYHTFKLKPTAEMLPSVKLHVYMIQNDKLVYYDTEIKFEEILNNFIKIGVPTQAKPGEQIDINISTNPNSYVGLLGLDQSVLLLKSGNDLDKGSIFKKLKSFQYSGNYRDQIFAANDRQPLQDVHIFSNAMDYKAYHRFNYPQFDSKYQPHRYYSEGHMPYGSPGIPGLMGSGAAFSPSFMTSGQRLETGVSEYPVRKEFPETWLWTDVIVNNTDGSISIHEKIPDTITSWIVTGFSIDPVHGIGLTKTQRKIQVFQPFFVTTYLPYSVKQGEVISIPILVFNYMEENLDVEVSLDNEDEEFEFVELTNEILPDQKEKITRSKFVHVASNTGESITFMVRPKKIGNIKIKASGKSSLAGDSFEKFLRVKPEGVTEYINKAFIFRIDENNEMKKDVVVEVPSNTIPDSTFIEVSVVGDILGSTIKNLNNLIRMPSGCGEQNLVKFVPNILVLKYLDNIDQLTPGIDKKAKKFLEIGYQRQLSYKHTDGSFSSFGESNFYKKGSVWLTAFVVRSFRQATEYTNIDEDIINSALEFLNQKQGEDGSFNEDNNYDSFGTTKTGIPLTAFTALAFLENAKEYPKYNETIQKSLDFLVQATENSNDLYTIALTAYTLQRAKHAAKDVFLKKLQTKATIENDKKFWTPSDPKPEQNYHYYYNRNSINIEITSYALLTLLEVDQTEDVFPIIKWLISQRNINGGFSSSQDTIVGLQALAKFAEKYSIKNNNIEIDIKNSEGVEKKLIVNPKNPTILQTYEFPSSTKELTLTATGQGVAVVQVSYRYNIKNEENSPSFVITSSFDEENSKFKLTACTKFIANSSNNKSNMAIMEINLPSGFTVEKDSIKEIPGVQRVETENDDTVVITYFDNLDSTEICINLNLDRTYKVADQKPVPILVYDYYDDTRKARVFYNAPKSSLCDICEGAECKTKCS